MKAPFLLLDKNLTILFIIWESIEDSSSTQGWQKSIGVLFTELVGKKRSPSRYQAGTGTVVLTVTYHCRIIALVGLLLDLRVITA